MGGYIHKLKTSAGDTILPVSVTDAIYNEEGLSLTDILASLTTSQDTRIVDVDESGFFIVDSNGNVAFKVDLNGIDAIQLASTLLNKIKDQITTDFSSRNIAIFGDSISCLGSNWTTFFKSMSNFKNVYNYAVGGAKWRCGGSAVDLSGIQTGNDNNNLWNQYNRLNDAVLQGTAQSPDLIIMFAGANERYGNATQWGTPDAAFETSINYNDMDVPTTDVDTVAKSIRYIVEKTMSKYLDAKIILCTPIPITSDNNHAMRQVSELIRGCACELGCGVIDLYHLCGIHPVVNGTYTLRDGLHTNDKGSSMIAHTILNYIKNIL